MIVQYLDDYNFKEKGKTTPISVRSGSKQYWTDKTERFQVFWQQILFKDQIVSSIALRISVKLNCVRFDMILLSCDSSLCPDFRNIFIDT